MDILKEILSKKKQRLGIEKTKTPLKDLRLKIADMEKPRDFKTAIKRGSGGIRLIAEIKKASPSRGIIREALNLRDIAPVYQEKADAVSILTEEDFFMGSLSHLRDVRGILSKPILRKDFIFDEYQIYESRAYSADAILLIASILSKSQADEYMALAEELRMSVLFEVHDLKELEMALFIDAPIIGINNRDLKTMKIDLNTTLKLKKELPPEKIIVAESGIKSRADVIRLNEAGIDAMLIGSTFMEAEDIGRKIDELRGV